MEIGLYLIGGGALCSGLELRIFRPLLSTDVPTRGISSGSARFTIFKTKSALNILSVNEKLPVSKFQYFGKYIIQLFGYCYVHVSGQKQAGLER